MESIELTGKSIEELRAEAAVKLGVPEEQVEVEVIEQKRGLLGLMGTTLTVRATVRAGDAVGTARKSAPSEQPVVAADSSAEPVAGMEPDETEEAHLARLAHRAEEVTNTVLRLMGVEVSAQASEIAGDQVTVELAGEDIALIIGKHGDTLDALQLLVAIIANRDSEVNARVLLDAEGYRDRRLSSLRATAHAHAMRAKQTGREVVIRDLKAYERRVVHLELRDDPGVETYSEGVGRHRNLVISPVPRRSEWEASGPVEDESERDASDPTEE